MSGSVEDDKTMTPEDSAEATMLKEYVAALLEGLTERERMVLILRYGLMDGRPRTLEEVGQIFKVTRERVRQIEAKALRRLSSPVRSKIVRDFI